MGSIILPNRNEGHALLWTETAAMTDSKDLVDFPPGVSGGTLAFDNAINNAG